MNYSMMELVWLLLIYSFLGWVVETIVGTVKKKKFVNRGFSTGPFCLVYGIAAVFMAVTMEELMAEPVFQLIGCGVLATIIEWMAGKILERLNQHKWWDYSNKKWNFDGYICLQYSVLWAVLGFVAVRYGDAFFLIVYHMIPTLIREILLWILLAGMALDISASLAAVFHIRKEMPTAIRWNKKVAVWTQKFALMIVGHVEKRMAKAYPVIMEKTEQIEKEGNFAEGCGFYKLFWLFLIGAVLGDFTETIFCRLTAGVWMSRSSLVWGPFSIVWGLAIVGMIFKLLWVTCPKWVSSVIYIAMGWVCVLAMPQLVAGLSFGAFMWLLAGGLFYTVGGVIYAMKFPVFHNRFQYFGCHELFHVFVMAGSLCHFIVMYVYLCN